MPCIRRKEYIKGKWVDYICITTKRNKLLYDGKLDLSNKKLRDLLKRECKRVYNELTNKLKEK